MQSTYMPKHKRKHSVFPIENNSEDDSCAPISQHTGIRFHSVCGLELHWGGFGIHSVHCGTIYFCTAAHDETGWYSWCKLGQLEVQHTYTTCATVKC